jgi:5-(carboxyamino)imidazole ribonucleotide synthase
MTKNRLHAIVCKGSFFVFFCRERYNKKDMNTHKNTLGILGGGQLGRMMVEAASPLNLKIKILDPNPEAPCANMEVDFVVGDFNDEETVYAWGQDCERITIEIEHVNIAALKRLRDEGTVVYPQPEILEMIQDKGLQKQFYATHDIATSDFEVVENAQDDSRIAVPCVQKLRTGGYDGKGVAVLQTAQDKENAMPGPSVLEPLVDIEKEIAVIVARDEQGNIETYDPVEMIFDPVANLVTRLAAPANITQKQSAQATELATALMQKLEMVGILAVELFLTKDGQLMVNEVAPRAHNSGHHTIEACVTSQFEQLVRCVMGLPLGQTRLKEPAVMLNLLGEPGHTGVAQYIGMHEALALPGVSVHLYNKKDTKPMRKMGHVTIVAPTIEAAHANADAVEKVLKVVG